MDIESILDQLRGRELAKMPSVHENNVADDTYVIREQWAIVNYATQIDFLGPIPPRREVDCYRVGASSIPKGALPAFCAFAPGRLSIER